MFYHFCFCWVLPSKTRVGQQSATGRWQAPRARLRVRSVWFAGRPFGRCLRQTRLPASLRFSRHHSVRPNAKVNIDIRKRSREVTKRQSLEFKSKKNRLKIRKADIFNPSTTPAYGCRSSGVNYYASRTGTAHPDAGVCRRPWFWAPTRGSMPPKK